MNVNQNQTEISFEELVEMSGFSFGDATTPAKEETIISLEQEEEKTEEGKEKPEDGSGTEEPPIPPIKEETVEPIVSLQNNGSIYTELAKEKLASGEWQDVVVEIEGEKVKLSELANVDEDVYRAVKEDFDKEKEDNLKTKYVSVENTNDTQKALINIILSGDLDKAKELFEQPQNLVEPFQGYDSEDEAHNLQVLSWFYKSQGHSEKQIAKLIEADKEELVTDSKAEQIVKWQKNQFQEKIKKEEALVEESKKQAQERLKSYRKDLTAELKAADLTETMAKKFVDVATKYDPEGELEIDKIYDEWMTDPKKAKDLIYFLLDQEGYVKKITSTTKRDTQQDFLRQVNIVRDNSKITKSKEEQQEEKNAFEGMQFD